MKYEEEEEEELQIRSESGRVPQLVATQIDVIKSRQAMVDVFLSDFESEIQTYKEELSAFAEKGDALRESTLDKRVEVFKALHQKMELYAGLLQFEPKDVKAKITELEQGLSKIKFGRKVKLDEDDKKTANG